MKTTAPLACLAVRLRVPSLLSIAIAGLLPYSGLRAQQVPFSPGNLVVAVEGCGIYGGTCTAPNGTGTGVGNSVLGGYGDNQAAPMTLMQFLPAGTSAATYVSSLTLPQTAAGNNLPVSGEYGSSSEATLQVSGNGQYLAVMGYGVPAGTFNANPALYGAAPSLALAQSGSLIGQGYLPVPRVLALIDAFGNVSSSTALYNVFNTNNPRSAFSNDGTDVYVSGQGASSDTTGGVFYSLTGASNSAPTSITGLDTSNNTAAQDTRTVQVVNGRLLVSVDSKAGSAAARDFLGTLGTPEDLPTLTVGAPVMLTGFGDSVGSGRVTINGTGNGLNDGLQVNLSPSNYFFATPSILYVADTGSPKNNSATSSLGDGGLQKWINSAPDGSGTWTLAYTLARGLNLVQNSTGHGTSGLYGLAGTVQNGQVLLYATSYTLSDLDTTYLYGITDQLNATTPAQVAAESFSILQTAPLGSNFKGVSFAPTLAAQTQLQVSAIWIPGSTTGYSLLVSVTNAGLSTAQDVTLTSVSVAGIPALSSPLALGPIATGSSVTATVPVPLSVGPPSSAVLERVSGSYSGGSFGATQRGQLPTVQ